MQWNYKTIRFFFSKYFELFWKYCHGVAGFLSSSFISLSPQLPVLLAGRFFMTTATNLPSNGELGRTPERSANLRGLIWWRFHQPLRTTSWLTTRRVQMPGSVYVEVLITSSTGLMEHELCSHPGVVESQMIPEVWKTVVSCGTTEEPSGMMPNAATDVPMSVKKVKFV